MLGKYHDRRRNLLSWLIMCFQRTDFSMGLSLFCWVIGGIITMLGGLCFAEMGAMLPKAGGMTVYLNTAFHPLLGF